MQLFLREKVGKLITPPQIQALADSTKQSRLFLRDHKLNLSYLVDTGTDISILSKKKVKGPYSLNFKLFTANGSEIKTYGHKVTQVNLGLIICMKVYNC